MKEVYKVKHSKKAIPADYVCFTSKHVAVVYGTLVSTVSGIVEKYWRDQLINAGKRESFLSFVEVAQVEKWLTDSDARLRDIARKIIEIE